MRGSNERLTAKLVPTKAALKLCCLSLLLLGYHLTSPSYPGQENSSELSVVTLEGKQTKRKGCGRAVAVAAVVADNSCECSRCGYSHFLPHLQASGERFSGAANYISLCPFELQKYSQLWRLLMFPCFLEISVQTVADDVIVYAQKRTIVRGIQVKQLRKKKEVRKCIPVVTSLIVSGLPGLR